MSRNQFAALRMGQAIPRGQIPHLSGDEFRKAIVNGVSRGQRVAALFGDAPPPAPRIVAGAVRVVEANRLEPRMPLRAGPVLLGDLALEEVDLRAVGSQRWESILVQG